jgi:PAS domain S-box-containing protein
LENELGTDTRAGLNLDNMPMTHFMSVMRHAPMGVAIYAPQGALQDANAVFCDLFAMNLQTALSQHWTMQNCDAFFGIVDRVLAGEHLYEHEITSVREDGATIEFSLSTIPQRIDGALISIVMLVNDISARKLAERAEIEQRIYAEALRDTASAMTRTLNRQELFKLILDNVDRVVPHETANIMLVEGDHVRIAHLKGYPPETYAAYEHARVPIAEMETLVKMIATGEPLLIANTHTDPLWKWLPTREWVQSYVATPIFAYGHVIGFLNLDSATVNAFQPSDAHRLRVFADQAAVALENAQLYEAMYRDASEMRALHRATSFLFASDVFASNSVREVCERVATTVVNEFGTIHCSVLMRDTDTDDVICLAQVGDESIRSQPFTLDRNAVVLEAIRSSHSMYSPDVIQSPLYEHHPLASGSELIIPLKTAKGVFGALELQSREIGAFDPQDMQILQAFAERAAVAIENMQLYNEIQQRVRDRTTELNRVKTRAEAILNHSSDAILLIRADGRIQQTNLAFNMQFGFSNDALYNRSFEMFMGEYYKTLLTGELEEVIGMRTSRRAEVIAVRSDGSSFDADVVMSPVMPQNVGERVTSVVCSLRDISDRKRLERELRTALETERELNELKTRFVSRVSHEFRTPLTVIRTSTEMLQRYPDRLDAVQRNEKIERIQTEVNHLIALLEDLLAISKAQEVGYGTLHLESTSLVHLCCDVISEINAGHGADHAIVLSLEGEFSPTMVMVDRKHMRRALANLVSNAVKYSPPGSRVDISLIYERDEVRVVVEDRGIGIPEDDLERLFEPFHRAHNVDKISGTGLGLAIVKQAAESHGGSVQVRSQLGNGSVFTLLIPRVNGTSNEG